MSPMSIHPSVPRIPFSSIPSVPVPRVPCPLCPYVPHVPCPCVPRVTHCPTSSCPSFPHVPILVSPMSLCLPWPLCPLSPCTPPCSLLFPCCPPILGHGPWGGVTGVTGGHQTPSPSAVPPRSLRPRGGAMRLGAPRGSEPLCTALCPALWRPFPERTKRVAMRGGGKQRNGNGDSIPGASPRPKTALLVTALMKRGVD